MSALKKYVVDKFSLTEDHADWDYPSLIEPVRIALAADVEAWLVEYRVECYQNSEWNMQGSTYCAAYQDAISDLLKRLKGTP